MPRIGKTWWTVVLFIVIAMQFPVAFAAGSISDITITVEGTQKLEINQRQIAIQADVAFHNPSFINDSLALSYHIFDAEDKLILFEGQRTYLKAYKNDAVKAVPIVIDLNQIEEVRELKKFSIVMDIVDEKNIFWFSQNEEIRLSSASITYDDSQTARVRRVFAEIVAKPLLLIINFILYGVMIYGVLRYKRSVNKKI